MPRLFFAIRTSDAQRGELRQAQKQIVTQLDTLGAHYRLENLNNSHCTLRFLGSIEEVYVETLIQNARREIEATKTNPFQLSLTTCGTFSHRGKTRVIWAGLTTAPELLRLRNAIDRAIAQSDIVLESKEDFHPHLTLARLKMPFRMPSEFAFPALSPKPATVSEIELIDSKTLATGAVHEVRAIFALQSS